MTIRLLLCGLTMALLSACQTAQAPTPASTAAAASTSMSALDRTGILSLAGSALGACATNMPDSRATRAALAEAGLPSYGTRGPLWFNSPRIGELVVGTSASGRDPFCLVVVRRLTEAEAAALIAPVVAQANGQRAPGLDESYLESWIGQINGRPVILFIDEDFRVPGLISGRAIGIAFV